ncbi:MAG TPA: M28 family peptidase [Bacteroidota bacterium]|nr:M28 family peptidase [Bacteroidota bacterium]
MKRAVLAVVVLLLFATDGFAQAQQEISDSAVVARFKEEGLQNSQVMDVLSYLCDVYGPRLAWSPAYKRAADWASGKLKEWGLQNVYYDNWAPLGKGWRLEDFSAVVKTPTPFPVIAFPLAWSPRIKEKEADVVFLDVKKMEDFDAYKGKLKGKFVLLSEPVEVQTRFDAAARRLADSLLLRMANADLQSARRGFRRGPGFFPRNVTAQNLDSIVTAAHQMNPALDVDALRQRLQQQMVNPHKLEFVQEEGALAAITTSRGDGGNLIVQSAQVPQPEGTAFNQRVAAYDAKAPEIIPQVVFAAEHYNRIVRMIQKGEKVKLDMKLDVEMTKADSGFNIIGEIPGTDLKDEVVMLGGHFDSWHGGTGATDDGSGTAASMEAMRILKTLQQKYGMTMRRTVRVGLWGAEEEGLIGSREYVSQYFAKREGATGGGFGGGGGTLVTTPAYDKLYVYLNHDNGTGRIRGIYLQGNEEARPIFRNWFALFGDPTAQTITIQNTGGTDHQSFDGVGLPGFQFIQDPIDYEARTHHYIMDVYERLQPEDMKQAATIMAFFAYEAANRDGKFPRKPVQQGGRPGGF